MNLIVARSRALNILAVVRFLRTRTLSPNFFFVLLRGCLSGAARQACLRPDRALRLRRPEAVCAANIARKTETGKPQALFSGENAARRTPCGLLAGAQIETATRRAIAGRTYADEARPAKALPRNDTCEHGCWQRHCWLTRLAGHKLLGRKGNKPLHRNEHIVTYSFSYPRLKTT